VTELIRIGAVNYLNTKPLIYDLEGLTGGAELILDYPSRLADDLQHGRLDVALIPIIEYFRTDGYTLVPDIAIASHGPVLSVTLFSRVPWTEIRRVALDEGSRTSAALTQVLLRKRYGVRPEVCPLPLDRAAEDVDADAVLLIGDRAMGLPFVYAAWAVRPGVDLGLVADALALAKERGCANLGPIAAAEAPRLGLDAGFCRRYLANIIRFDLGPRALAGLHHYYMLASELGLARRGMHVRFYQAGEALAVNP
jgi:chorismate dehydratase